MIDLRYLALTMIGIFLALAIGLMVGSALGSPERQAQVFERLRTDFELLREQNQKVHDENAGLRRRMAAREQAGRELLPAALRARLPGSTVGVILCGNWSEGGFWRDLESALNLAGAQVGPVLRIPDQLRPLSPELRERLRGGAPAPVEGNGRFEPVAWAVRAMGRVGGAERLQEIARETGMELGGNYQNPVRRVLVLTSVPDEQRAALVAAGDVPELRVVEAAQAEGLRIVVAEPEAIPVSAVDLFRARNVPTVDNIDTAAGQISAVLALSGKDGHFGSKAGATRAIAPLDRP